MVPGSGAETDLLLSACIVLQMVVIVPFFNLEWLLYLFQLTERRLYIKDLSCVRIGGYRGTNYVRN